MKRIGERDPIRIVFESLENNYFVQFKLLNRIFINNIHTHISTIKIGILYGLLHIILCITLFKMLQV